MRDAGGGQDGTAPAGCDLEGILFVGSMAPAAPGTASSRGRFTQHGAGRFQANDKRRFFEIAKGSATEVAAVVDLLHTCGHASAPSRRAVRSLAVRVVQMLSRLAATLT